MKAPIKKHIQDKFSEEILSDEKLNALMQFQESQQDKQANKTKIQARFPGDMYNFTGIAAMAIIAVALLIMTPFKSTNMALEIANEVSHNHFKLKPLEVQSSVLSEVNSYFTKLDFEPISSSLISASNQILLGARYCSLQGITAAQIRFRAKDGKITTFYEVPYNESIYSKLPHVDNGEEPIVVYSRGIGVKIWVEKGILMAMTL